MSIQRLALAAMLLLLCSCTQRTFINYMASDEDRAFAYAFVAKMRAADEAGLQPMFSAGLWEPSRAQIALAPRQFPASAGNTDLIGFHTNREVGGNNRRTAQFVLFTDDGQRWTRTTIVTVSFSGHPQQVIAWSVVGTDSMPEDYQAFLRTEAVLPWVQAAFAAILIALAIILVLRRRRRLELND